MNSPQLKVLPPNAYPDSKRPNSLEAGLEFQDFAVEQIQQHLGLSISLFSSRKYQLQRGESVQGFEFKLDARCTDFNRLSVETGEKSQASNVAYVPSGIYREDNTWIYVQGNFDILFVFAKSTLPILHQLKCKDGTWRFQRKEEPTLQAFYLPFKEAATYAAKVLDFRKGHSS